MTIQADWAILFNEKGVEGAKALRGLRKDLTQSERHPNPTDVTLDAAIENLPTGSGFAAYNWAGLAKLGASYATLYWRACTSSHGGAGGTLEYLKRMRREIRWSNNVNPRLEPNF